MRENCFAHRTETRGRHRPRARRETRARLHASASRNSGPTAIARSRARTSALVVRAAFAAGARPKERASAHGLRRIFVGKERTENEDRRRAPHIAGRRCTLVAKAIGKRQIAGRRRFQSALFLTMSITSSPPSSVTRATSPRPISPRKIMSAMGASTSRATVRFIGRAPSSGS